MTSSTVHTTRRGARLAVPLGLAAALLLTACGGGDGSATPSPTGSADASVLPSRTDSLASPTRSPTRRESADATPSATVTVTESPEGSAPATAGEPTESPAASSEGQEASEGGIPAWAWVLLVAGALAAVLAILLRRSRRRRSWQADLSAAEEEVAWFAGELLPQLQRAASPDEVAGGWRVATRRVTSIEDRLTGLEASARDEAGRTRARQLRDAVRDARQAVDDVVRDRNQATQVRDLSSTSTRLVAALATPTPT